MGERKLHNTNPLLKSIIFINFAARFIEPRFNNQGRVAHSEVNPEQGLDRASRLHGGTVTGSEFGTRVEKEN